MEPVMTSRQVRNGGLRAMGIVPRAGYHTRVGPGDEVAVENVEEEPFRVERFRATVRDLTPMPGLGYLLVTYEREGGRIGQARIFLDGPPPWGVIEFRVIRRVHRQRQPEPDDGPPNEPENMLRRLPRRQRCPRCRELYDWIPKAGWPCLPCRQKPIAET